uniref:Uncharacterized protein n=1 Tax=Tanacetum cinerariifolium TaxID=118510 RepID=A0A6L2NPX7_TANCI|nr:hypothetical protein [Tanacetum cinerariifolium]
MIYVFIMHITYITVRALYNAHYVYYGTPPLLPIPLYTPSTSRRAGIPKADTPPRNRPLLATPRPSIPSEDPYEETAQQLFEQAQHSLEYVPRDHVPVFVLEFEHPEDLDEAHASLLPPRFLSPRIRPLSPRALEAEMNAVASSLYHSLHPSGTPPLLPIPLSTPSTSRRAGIPEADTPPRNMPLLATPRPRCEVRESSTAAARRPRPTMAHEVDCSYVETRLQDTERRMMAALELVNLRDHAAVRAEIKELRSERLAYEQEGIQTCEALARSEAYCWALEARVAVLETHVRRLEWQHQYNTPCFWVIDVVNKFTMYLLYCTRLP